jgi:electron transfer flavoprotein beta subunit
LQHEYVERNLFIQTYSADDLKVDEERCGIKGSPTKVHKVESVVLSGGSQEMIEPTRDGMGILIDKLLEDRIF